MFRFAPKLAAVLAALVLVAAAVAGVVRTGRADSDPTPTVNDNLKHVITPGPGWPKGWTPPPVPTAIPQKVMDDWNFSRQMVSDPPARLVMWMYLRDPMALPDWTKQYPYVWALNTSLICGHTQYAIYYPAPDRKALYDAYGDGYDFLGADTDPTSCSFRPIYRIEPTLRLTDEQKEQSKLYAQMDGDFAYSRLEGTPGGKLRDCVGDLHDATPDNIYVCFNEGAASPRFDAPAYLDASVGRVRVPVRFVSEMMRADVNWDGDTQTVTIHFPATSRDMVVPTSRPGFQPSDWPIPDSYDIHGERIKLIRQTVNLPERTIVLTVGKGTALVDGKEVPLDAPPVIQPPGRTMVPVRFVAEAMGAKVYWVGDQPIWKKTDGTLGGRYQVHIYTPLFPFFAYPNWFLETRAQKY